MQNQHLWGLCFSFFPFLSPCPSPSHWDTLSKDKPAALGSIPKSPLQTAALRKKVTEGTGSARCLSVLGIHREPTHCPCPPREVQPHRIPVCSQPHQIPVFSQLQPLPLLGAYSGVASHCALTPSTCNTHHRPFSAHCLPKLL